MLKFKIGDTLRGKKTGTTYVVVGIQDYYIQIKRQSDEFVFSIALPDVYEGYEKIDYTTTEMMFIANSSEETYKLNDLYYNKKNGFTDKYGSEWKGYTFSTLNEFINETGWNKIERNKMTLSQIEEKLGYEIELIKE